MTQSTIFKNNRSQAVRMPAELRFPDTVKKVTVRAVGHERVITPIDNAWDSFFLANDNAVTNDFLEERASQHQSERDGF